MPKAEPVGIRLARKIAQQDACIVWTGACRPGGYGVMGGTRNSVPWYDSPHRLVYELVRGPIPAGQHIDHLCGVRRCVNPDHLEAVTQAINNQRANRKRFHGVATTVPASMLTVRDLVALISGERP